MALQAKSNLLSAKNRRSALLLITLAVGAAVDLIVFHHASLTTSAQKQSSSNSNQRRKSTATQKPSPIPRRSKLDALGEAPAMPRPSPKVIQEISPGEVISVDTTEIMLPVTVREANGRFVTSLTRKDFRVFEDDREQPLSDLALRQVPVDVVLMVDASSSVASNLDDFRRAVEGFVTRLAPEDRISLIKFDDRVELLQDWTQSKFQLQRALNRISAGMFTRFNDALLLAARDQFSNSRSRRAVIVLTDGIDSGRGAATFESALTALLETQVTVYVVSNTEMERASKRAELDSMIGGTDSEVRFNQLRIDDLREGLRVIAKSEERLSQLTTATGGRLYKPLSFNSLDSTYAEVAEELRHQYALYYTPINKARDGSFRRVRVETTKPAEVHTRIGYFAPRH
jgi:Ca-activated chloride channel family protein